MKILLSLSGGLDSTVLLAKAVSQGLQVQCVSFTYPTKHNNYEWLAANKIADYYKVPLKTVDVRSAFASFDSALIDKDKAVPEGHYEAESMRATVVPCRNLIFASILAGLADSMKLDRIWLGTHAGDHFIYPDCRPQFNQYLDAAIRVATENRVEAHFPFQDVDKSEIIRQGLRINVPFEKTRTCYSADTMACGKCASCQERLHSFLDNGAKDPLPYLTRTLYRKEGD